MSLVPLATLLSWDTSGLCVRRFGRAPSPFRNLLSNPSWQLMPGGDPTARGGSASFRLWSHRQLCRALPPAFVPARAAAGDPPPCGAGEAEPSGIRRLPGCAARGCSLPPSLPPPSSSSAPRRAEPAEAAGADGRTQQRGAGQSRLEVSARGAEGSPRAVAPRVRRRRDFAGTWAAESALPGSAARHGSVRVVRPGTEQRILRGGLLCKWGASPAVPPLLHGEG